MQESCGNKKKRPYCLLAVFVLLFPVATMAMETTARQALLLDLDTHTVLLAKNPDEPMPPSSMSKLMTLYVVFQHLKDGRIKLGDKLMVSEKAWRMQGSKTFVPVGGEVTVEDLIRGVAVQSGNDACIVLAEGLKGSEEAFAREMNRLAQEIGLKRSHFVNATGWPDEQHVMSARDLALLAERLISDFPEYYHYFAEKEFTYHKITQPNRNLLLASNLGVDGLKTGHTEAAGYGITLSAKDPQGRRLLLVLNGLKKEKERAAEGDRLLRYGFREFETVTLLRKGQAAGDAPVWFGQQATVALAAAEDIRLTLPAGRAKDMRVQLVYDSPIPAPVMADARVAELVIHPPEPGEEIRVPLVAARTIERMSGMARLFASLEYRLFGHK